MGCSRRNVWLSAFLCTLVVGFTAQLVAIVTPTWQYVYLEDGRTEHHHGLWLDCKRDYSNEYGRPKEYYETLYKLDHMQSPFDQFWLPPLLCVYKFDYWLDDEDWYEHGYDENRLQGDAYQHLFIGWKIAALTAHSFGTVCSLAAVVILMCGFCHRLLICVSTVLVALAVITSTIGNVVFYMFANYQDNSVIHEDDGDYQQYFGWSFYCALMGNLLVFAASVIGCMATTAVLSGKAKLVKIEIGEHDEDRLLQSGSSVMNPSFKRSLSAVYKVDSAALRKWEREAMRSVRMKGKAATSTFQRTNSMPALVKKSRSQQPSFLMSSTSDISKAITEPVAIRNRPPSTTPFDSRATSGTVVRFSDDEEEEVVYEYVEPHSITLSSDQRSGIYGQTAPPLPKRPQAATNLNVYDSVHSNTGTPRSSFAPEEDDEYLKPIPTPLISSPTKPSSFKSPSPTTTANSTATANTVIAQPPKLWNSVLSRQEIEQRFERTSLFAIATPPTAPRAPPPKPPIRSSLRHKPLPEDSTVQINTFDFRGGDGRIRSLTNLTAAETPPTPMDRAPATIRPRTSSIHDLSAASLRSASSRLLSGLKETSFDVVGSYAPSETNRSIGSGITFRPPSPTYDLDDDRSTTSTSVSGQSNNGGSSNQTQPTQRRFFSEAAEARRKRAAAIAAAVTARAQKPGTRV